MDPTILPVAPKAIAIISSLFLTLSPPTVVNQCFVLENDILLNNTYNQAVNAVISSKETQQPEFELPEINDKEEIKSLISQTASQYNINPDQLLNIAICESGLNPNAQNGIYGGLFQFSEGTWQTNRNAMAENPDLALRYNAAEAIKTAGFKISRDGTGAWAGCQK